MRISLNRLSASAKRFLRGRWEVLRTDGYLQLFLAGLLLTLPLLYWGQFLLRAGLLLAWAGILILVRLVRHDLVEIRRLGCEVQLLDPDLPRHLIFFHLQLRNRFVSRVVFRFRLFLALNICLLLLNNPLWLVLVDPLLGFLFWLPLAVSEELYLLRRHGPSAGPVGSKAGAGFRTAAEQALNHVQQNPRFYGIALTVGSGLGYMGKSYWDGMIQKGVNTHASNLEVIAHGKKLEQQALANHQAEQLRQQAYETRMKTKLSTVREIADIEVSKDRQRADIEVSKDRQRADIEVSKDRQRADIEVSKAERLSRIRLDELGRRVQTGEADSRPPAPKSTAVANRSASSDEPDLCFCPSFPNSPTIPCDQLAVPPS